MPFLALNGYIIPVALGGEEQNEAIGFPMVRAHNGSPMTDARAYKRTWRFSTIPLTEMVARAIIGMVQGRGYGWIFANEYSSNGLTPESGSVTTVRSMTAADGASTYDENGTAYGNFGGVTIAVEAACTNVLYSIATDGPNIATGTDALTNTNGFTAIGTASLARTTTYKWQGSGSLEMNPAAISGDGVRTAFATVSSNATVTASVYVRVNGTQSVVLRLYQNSGAPALLASNGGVTPTSGTWRRLSITATLTGGNTTCALQVETANNATENLYCDGFQIEESAFPTAWTTTARTGGFLKYASALAGFEDTTINAWVCCSSANTSSPRMIAHAGGSSSFVSVYREASANSVQVDAGSGNNVVYSSSPWDNNWHMVTAVVRRNAESGESGLELYWDATSRGTDTINSNYTGMTSTDPIYIGCKDSAGTSPFNQGRIDDMMILPYAAPAAAITAWYNFGRSVTTQPKLYLTGDIIPETRIEVIGEVNRASFKPHHNGAAWRPNGRIIDFTLYEV